MVGPSDASASSQVSYINTLITQRENAIVLAANDPNGLQSFAFCYGYIRALIQAVDQMT